MTKIKQVHTYMHTYDCITVCVSNNIANTDMLWYVELCKDVQTYTYVYIPTETHILYIHHDSDNSKNKSFIRSTMENKLTAAVILIQRCIILTCAHTPTPSHIQPQSYLYWCKACKLIWNARSVAIRLQSQCCQSQSIIFPSNLHVNMQYYLPFAIKTPTLQACRQSGRQVGRCLLHP